jgi:adenosylcobinamide kinase/adenosylcobinamide-phosphate guanylyltransferase
VKRFILILGGARSGKSRYAVKLAKEFSSRKKLRVAFIATATWQDQEMKGRIRLHKTQRPRKWKLIEEGKDISACLSKLEGRYQVVIIDCLGFFISNLLMNNSKDKEIEKRIKALIDTIKRVKHIVILVSNEVGSGVVPTNPLARRFRDLLGLANQRLAKKADEVIFLQAGIPLKLKMKPGHP